MPKVAPAPAAQEVAPHLEKASERTTGPRATRAWAAAVPVVCVVAPFAVAYVVLALVLPLPVIYQDEGFYQHLARSLAHGQGFMWRDEPVQLRSALYVYLLAPIWLVASGVRAWEIAKVETALLSCLVAVPVWLLARELLSRRLALLTVALSLAGTWMAGSGSLMTESVALPLATGSLALTVQALRRPSAKLPWLALLLALLAAWARLQLVVLVPVIVAALLLDVARHGRRWRTAARRHRAPLIATAALLAVAAVVVGLTGRSAIGGYSAVAGFRPDAVAVLRSSGLELLQLAALCGVLPMLLLGALVLRPASWRDPVIGPLLAVLVPAVLALAVQNGFYVGGVDGLWPIQRYMIYAAPLLLVFAVTAVTRQRLLGRWTVLAVVLWSTTLLWMPEVAERSEQRAAFATVERIRDLLPSASAGTAMVVATLALGTIVGLSTLVGRLRGRQVAPAAVGASLLVLLVMQTVTAMAWQLGVERTARKQLPQDLAWVDHHSHGPVSVLQLTTSASEFPLLDFFNEDIARVYAFDTAPPGPVLPGKSCRWVILPDGFAKFAPGCPPPSDQFFINDPFGHLTFYNEISTAKDAKLGRIVTVRGRPRVRSAVSMPCSRPLPNEEPVTLRVLPDQPAACRPMLSALLWNDRPGIVRVGVRGAPSAAHTARVGTKEYAIAPGGTTTLSIPVRTGQSDLAVTFDWAQRSPLDPEVVSVDLEQDGRRTSLL
jgi:hypothetical protein